MKYAVLLVACLIFVVFAHAQISAPATGKFVTIQSNGALDSCLKKIIPNLNSPSILLDLPNEMVAERRRAIGVILEKLHCPVMGFQKFEPTKPAAVGKLDSGAH